MVDPLVRPASDGDAPEVRYLEAEARAAQVGQRGGDRWLVEHAEVGGDWAGWIERGDVVVATIDEVVVGYLAVSLSNDVVLRIEQVWVDPAARELGFGDALLALAIERGRAAGATAVEGWSLPGDRHMKNLYERAGIVARLITTYKELPPLSDPSRSGDASR